MTLDLRGTSVVSTGSGLGVTPARKKLARWADAFKRQVDGSLDAEAHAGVMPVKSMMSGSPHVNPRRSSASW